MKTRTLMSTIELLDLLKSLNSNASDYRIAQILNVNKSAVSKWRVGRSGFDDETAVRVAELSGLQPEYVLACVHAERAKTDQARTAWAHIAAAFGTAAALVLLLGIPAHFPL